MQETIRLSLINTTKNNAGRRRAPGCTFLFFGCPGLLDFVPIAFRCILFFLFHSKTWPNCCWFPKPKKKKEEKIIAHLAVGLYTGPSYCAFIYFHCVSLKTAFTSLEFRKEKKGIEQYSAFQIPSMNRVFVLLLCVIIRSVWYLSIIKTRPVRDCFCLLHNLLLHLEITNLFRYLVLFFIKSFSFCPFHFFSCRYNPLAS